MDIIQQLLKTIRGVSKTNPVTYIQLSEIIRALWRVPVEVSYTYTAFASDDIGTDFTLVNDTGLPYMAVLVSPVEIPEPVVGDFDGLWRGASVQLQSDWNQASNTEPDYIKNKPSIPAAQVNSDWNAGSGLTQILNKPSIPNAQVQTDWNATTGMGVLLNKPSIPAAQIQGDWMQSSTEALDYIKNKPSIPAAIGYLEYSAFVTQSGTGNPSVIELKNTIGAIVATRTATGTYRLTLSGAFTADKTSPIDDIMMDQTGNLYTLNRIDANYLELKTYAAANISTLADGVLNKRYINITVFP